MYLSTSSANSRSWRWCDSDIVWHLNPFFLKKKLRRGTWTFIQFTSIYVDFKNSRIDFTEHNYTSSRHCFWHIWQYHRSFCKPLALILFDMAFGVNAPAFSLPMLGVLIYKIIKMTCSLQLKRSHVHIIRPPCL